MRTCLSLWQKIFEVEPNGLGLNPDSTTYRLYNFALVTLSVPQFPICKMGMKTEPTSWSVFISGAATTKYHRLSGLKNRNLIVHSSGGQKSEIRASARLVTSGVAGGESIPCPSLSFWWLPAVLDVAWLVDASLQFLPLSTHNCLPSVCLCVQSSLFL